MFLARPATIIEKVQVADHITGERDITVKETEAFFHLRNHIRDLMRDEGRRNEEMAERALMTPEEGGK